MNAIVNATICPLMQRPDHTATLADEALFGMTVQVLGNPAPDWYKVRTHYGYEGFAPAECLLFGSAAAARWGDLPKRLVTHGYCTVLAAPRVQSWTVVSLTRGAVIAVEGPPDGECWQRVTLPNGWCGYTKSSFLGEYYEKPPQLPVSELRARIVAAALSYQGTHYRWGGKTVLGIDCSGLTSMAYLLNGIFIFRDAHIAEGFPVRAIDRAALQPADLLYFHGPDAASTGTTRPAHTALYLGQDKFIHATAHPGSDGVVVSSLNPAHEDYRADLADSVAAIGSVF